MGEEISLKAYAKINLFLEIESKRKDGYHNIQSIFGRISLFDEIRMRKISKGIELDVEDNSNLGEIPKEKNLVYKACLAFFERFKIKSGVEIYLKKNIPVGAGLGGGSSDCASVLKGLSLLYSVKNEKDLLKLSASLGSDVPFFMKDYSFARCYGRGERIEVINVVSKLPYILIIWPDEFISTDEVYKNFTMGKKSEIRKNVLKMKDFIKELETNSGYLNFSNYLFNRFENFVFEKYPSVKKVKELAINSSLPCLMSGSGSSVFILSYEKKDLSKLVKQISSLHKFIFLAKFI